MLELERIEEMHNDDDQPIGIFVGTAAEIIFLVLTIVVAACFGRFGGPFDEWVRQGGFDSGQVAVFMYLAWSVLVLGILARKPAFRYGFLTCWMVLASLMRIYQEQNPLMNLVTALGVLVAVTLSNRIGRNRSSANAPDN